MTADMVRGGAANAVGLVVEMLVEIVLGVCLMCLFLLALAWDPFDRRLGFRAKRRAGRLDHHADSLPPDLAQVGEEPFGVGPAK
jgi:hypothetical protein